GPLPLAVSADEFDGTTAFDFIYPSELSTNLVIPFAPGDTSSVDVNVFNPGPNQAEVKVVLMQVSGAHTDVRTATLDPLHSTTISLSNVINVYYAFVTTSNLLRPNSPVAASAIVRNFAPGASGAVPRTDFAVVPAIPQSKFSPAAEVPFFTQGPDYFSIVQVDNLSNSKQTISITALRADGTPLPGTSNPASVDLPPYGSVRQEMFSLFGSTSTDFSTGTIIAKATGTNGVAPSPLAAPVAMGNVSEPGLA